MKYEWRRAEKAIYGVKASPDASNGSGASFHYD